MQKSRALCAVLLAGCWAGCPLEPGSTHAADAAAAPLQDAGVADGGDGSAADAGVPVLDDEPWCNRVRAQAGPEVPTAVELSRAHARVRYKYGYILSGLFNCSCGYSANFIVQNARKINNSATLKRTCKECSSVWNFNKDDVTMSDVKKFMTIANPTLATIITESKDYDFNRCDKCGSRKVTVELIEENLPKMNLNKEDNLDKMNLKSEEYLAKAKLRREESLVKIELNKESGKVFNRKFKELGGYNKKALIAIIVSLLLCVTPLWPFGLLLSIPSLIWFIVDTTSKVNKVKKHKNESEG
jgi:hypothetical protein